MQRNLSELSANKNNQTDLQSSPGAIVALDAPGVATKIATRIKEEIDRYCVQAYDGGHRKHLGASLIGRSCKRYLWYVFRWCKRQPTTGRQQRLFNRGHREEARFIEWLEGIGFKLWFEDYTGLALDEATGLYFISPDYGEMVKEQCSILETNPEFKAHIARAKLQGLEFPQYRISDIMGHFGGSLDGIATFPPGWGIDEPVLLEFKTSGTGSKFTKLADNKMPVEKPDHFAQTSTYGYKYKFRFVLYFCINKNDDDLHIEVAKLDWNLGENMISKAGLIITSQTPPPKLSESPTFQDCRYCDMRDICHEGASIERNCRSCEFATPVDGGQWQCSVHNGIIPLDFIPTGCPQYKAIV
jgi:hypothetical protein